jgi:predicted GH43/DUF377 family glycosyl hydrolase
MKPKPTPLFSGAVKSVPFRGLRKHEGNPILVPRGTAWESDAVFNPAAWTDGTNVYLLYRAEGPSPFRGRATTSCIGLAISEDGFTFRRDPRPVIEPTEPYEIPGGCEDPRLVQVDRTFYLTYTAFDGRVARMALAVSHDLRNWQKCGVVFPEDRWEQFFPRREHRELFPTGWCKSGAVLATPLHGYYWMYFGDTHIWAAFSRDLRAWQVVEEPVLSPREQHFDARLVEPGPPPLCLESGIWLGYNCADQSLRYRFGQCLLSRDSPAHVQHRCDYPLLEPTTDEEVKGRVANVTFAEGLVLFRGMWLLYYGMADSRIGVAIVW